MKLNSISIRRRLLFAFTTLVIVTTLIGSVSIFDLAKTNGDLKHFFSYNLPAVDWIIEADRDLQQLLVAQRTLVFTEPGSEVYNELVTEYEENKQQSEDRVNKYRAIAESDREKEILTKYDVARSAWESSTQMVMKLMAEGGESKTKAVEFTMGDTKAKFEVMRDLLDQLTEVALADAEEKFKDGQNSFLSAIITFTILLGLAIIGGIVLAIQISKSITKPLRNVLEIGNKVKRGELPETDSVVSGNDEMAELTKVFYAIVESLKEKGEELNRIANGDLTVEVTYLSDKDEFAQLFDKMLNSLNSSLYQVRSATDQVSAGSEQISQTSQLLADGASLQASSLQEISSSLNEISNQADKNTEDSGHVRERAIASKETAESGNAQMKTVVEAMNEITVSADSIKTIVKTIDDIAFQTNLLALNAAVEAARAGQHGKGFAVVADEVRNLAHRSAQSAQTTTEKVDEAIRRIQEGSRLVHETAEQFSSILEGADTIATLINDIARASQDQAASLKETKVALVQVDEVTQSNAASSEENASTSEELMGQAETLRAMIRNFKLKGSEESISHSKIVPPVLHLPPETKPRQSKEVGHWENDFGGY